MSEQAMQALRKAQEIRIGKAALRRRIREPKSRIESSRVTADILEQRPACLRNFEVSEVLDWRYYAGRVNTRSILKHAGVGLSRPVGDLTDRELRDLCFALRSEATMRSAA